MWYTSPATSWNTESLPIGNGHMGGLVFGTISRERVHFSEKTLWTGGPVGETGNYRGGNRSAVVDPDVLETFRRQLDDKSQYVWGYSSGTSSTMLSQMWGSSLSGGFQDFGDIYLDFSKSGLTANNQVSNYVRDLDMNTAISSVQYDYDGVSYSREYFCSYPDNVMVLRLSASESGKLTFDASISGAQSGGSITAAGDTITYKGRISNNQMQYEAQLKVLNDGGAIAVDGSAIAVTGADEVVLIFACGTDYKNEYPVYRTGEDPHEAITQRITAASGKSYEELKEAHLEDYQELFSRVSVSLHENVPDKPTNELVEWYRSVYNATTDETDATADPADMAALEIMCYQFGRYLTIAGSREGSLPTNLQGVWTVGSAAWSGDYHFNVNVQMNYWPTLAANLAECATVFNDYMDSIREPGRVTAEYSHGIRSEEGEANGFVVHTQNNPFGHTAPGPSQEWGWNPTGGAWALETVYDYYLFTGDEDYLREKIYPMLKEQANFWENYLWYSSYQDRMVISPSISPEQGPTVNGTTYDQSVVWQQFENTIQAAEILGVDADRVDTWRDLQAQLAPIHIGDEGQIKEWYEETTIGRAKAGTLDEVAIPNWRAGNSGPHRHVSHLVGLYPGTLINKENPAHIEAAKVNLEERGVDGSGWSKGHKIALWARTGDGENTHRLVKSMVSGGRASQGGIAGFEKNLFDIHGAQSAGVYQIDGNFGYTAGVNEMFLQSQWGYTQFLPAIPEAWSKGSVNGLVARGNFVVGMEWSSGIMSEATVTSRIGGEFTGEYNGISGAIVTDSSGNEVDYETVKANRISFETEAEETYTISIPVEEVMKGKLAGVVEEAQELAACLTEERLRDYKIALEEAIATAEQVIADENADDYETCIDTLQTLTGKQGSARRIIELIAELDLVVKVYEQYDDPGDELTAMLNNSRQKLDEALAMLPDMDASVGDTASAVTQLAQAISDFATESTRSLTPAFQTDEDTLTLSSPIKGVEIRYTRDDSAPTIGSLLYTEPVPLYSVVYNAALFLDGSQIGNVAKVSYEGGNIAPTAVEVIAPNVYQNNASYNGQKAVDGSASTRWATEDGTTQATLELIFGGPVTVMKSVINAYTYGTKNWIKGYDIQYWEGGEWQNAASAADSEMTLAFDPVTASRFRLNITDSADPSIYEFELYSTGSGGLLPTKSFEELQQLINEAKQREEEVYTPESWNSFAAALRFAERQSGTSGSATLTDAYDALRDAMDRLEKLTVLLATDAHNVRQGDYVNISASFSETRDSNTVVFNYTFDGDKFTYADYHEVAGVKVVDKQYGDGYAKITLMIAGYNAEDLGILALHTKEDAVLYKEKQRVSAQIEYVLRDDAGGKTIEAASASTSFTTLGNGTPEPVLPGDTNGDGVVDLIDLSNMIDWFGIADTHTDWEDIYTYFDYNDNGEIDIMDIAYVAQLI